MSVKGRFFKIILFSLLMLGGGTSALFGQIDQKQKDQEAPAMEESFDQDRERSEDRKQNQASQQGTAQDLPAEFSEDEMVPGRINLKIKEAFRGQCSPNNIAIPELQDRLQSVGVKSISRSFPNAIPPGEPKDKFGRKMADLSLIYTIDFDPGIPVGSVVKMLENIPAVKYVEPAWIATEFYTPDDQKLPNSYHLDLIRAMDAWDISKGDTSIVIGIIDTGTSLTHPDLVNKLALNHNDPIDGQDNDGDGYTDNYYGWDFAGNGLSGPDNDPTYTGPDHGVLVAGAAAAETDNAIGVASTGFNSRYLPVKVNRDGQSGVLYGYSGVVYAADMGADIINCSWGSGAPSQFAKDAIDYAVVNKGCLVVAAAGNTPTFFEMYPASFSNVIGVAGTAQGDQVWYSNPSFGSSWSYSVDICAPARNIITTARHGIYWGGATGTSMASPLVAGAAAIVKSHFPQYNNWQVGQQLRVTAKDIYSLNPAYEDMLGVGRLDMYAAVTNQVPGIRIDSVEVTDNNNNLPEGFELVNVRPHLYNWLAPASQVVVSLSSPDTQYVKIVTPSQSTGAIGTLSGGTVSQPFKIEVKQPLDFVQEVWLRFGFYEPATGYKDFEYYKLTLYPSSVDVRVNDLEMSFSPDGNFGYSESFPYDEELGVRYQGSRSLVNGSGSLVIGANNGADISDAMQNQFGQFNREFLATGPIVTYAGPEPGDQVWEMPYDNSRAYSPNLDLEILQKVHAYAKAEYRDFVIVEYNITNRGSQDISDLNLGLYSTWAMPEAEFDPVSGIAYSYDQDSSHLPYIGIMPLDLDVPVSGVYNRWSHPYADSDKWTGITSGTQPTQIFSASPVQYLGSGPFLLSSQDEITVAFVIVSGESFQDLVEHADRAWEKYHCQYLGRNPDPLELGPDQGVCPGEEIVLDGGPGYASYSWSGGGSGQQKTVSNPGTYHLEVTNNYGCSVEDEVTVNGLDLPTTQLSDQESFCQGTSFALDAGGNGIAGWAWSTGDTTAVVSVSQPGIYSVELTGQNGCFSIDSVELSLFPYTPPVLDAQTVLCAGSSVSLHPEGPYLFYDWSTGDRTSIIQVDQPGTYLVDVQDLNGCSYTSQTTVSLVNFTPPNLGADTSVCQGDPLEMDAGTGYASYSWNNGATTQTVPVINSGDYVVTVVSAEGCEATTSINVHVFPVSAPNFGDSITICQPGMIDAGVSAAAYLWSTGETSRAIWVDHSQFLQLQIVTSDGCIAEDEVEILLREISADFEVEIEVE